VGNTRNKPEAAVVLAWYAAAVPFFWSFGYTIMRAGDLWWHLATGRWIVENGAIPFQDSWSYTAGDARWVVDAWLSDLIFHLWTAGFGPMSLAWWKWGLLVGMLCLLFHLLCRLWGNRAAAFVAVALAGATAAPFWDIRPHLYSMLLLVVLLELTLGRKRPSVLVVPLLLLWVNLHAGFALGLVALAILLLPFLTQKEERKRTVLIGAASLLVCFANPNTYHAITQPLLYAFVDSPFKTIGEWAPALAPGGIRSPFYPWMIALFLTAAIYVATRLRPIPWGPLALGLLTLAMSLQSRRFVPFFALAMTVVVTPLIRKLVEPLVRRLPEWAPPAVAFAVGLVLLWPYPQRSYAFHHMTGEFTLPVETVDFIEQNGIEGKVFTHWTWGGYLHLWTGGGLRVFIDGRASALFDDRTYLDYIGVVEGAPGWISVVEGSGAEYFLWPLDQVERARALIDTGRWHGVTADYLSVLLARTDRMPRSPRATVDSAHKRLSQGVLAFNRGDYPKAERELETALEMMPWEARACDWLARARAARGDLARARETVRECQRIFPMPHRKTLLESLER
jgi:hypothetical protein